MIDRREGAPLLQRKDFGGKLKRDCFPALPRGAAVAVSVALAPAWLRAAAAGPSSPSASTVLRLIASSYLIGAWTGRSAGFSPLRVRSRGAFTERQILIVSFRWFTDPPWVFGSGLTGGGEQMSLLSGFNVTFPEVELLGEAAIAAFAGGAIPVGWNVVTPQQLGVPSQYWDGNYFTNNGASAIVLQQGSTWIVSFRGTDGSNDVLQYPELVFGTYINHFQPLLSAVASNAPAGTSFDFTGASLGGGATNQMADIAGSQYGGKFAAAHFVAFASPDISTANGIL